MINHGNRPLWPSIAVRLLKFFTVLINLDVRGSKEEHNLEVLGSHFDNTNNPRKDRLKAEALFEKALKICQKGLRLDLRFYQIIDIRNRYPAQRALYHML